VSNVYNHKTDVMRIQSSRTCQSLPVKLIAGEKICVKKLRFQGQVQGHRVKVLGRKINNNVCDSKSILKCLC